MSIYIPSNSGNYVTQDQLSNYLSKSVATSSYIKQDIGVFNNCSGGLLGITNQIQFSGSGSNHIAFNNYAAGRLNIGGLVDNISSAETNSSLITCSSFNSKNMGLILVKNGVSTQGIVNTGNNLNFISDQVNPTIDFRRNVPMYSNIQNLTGGVSYFSVNQNLVSMTGSLNCGQSGAFKGLLVKDNVEIGMSGSFGGLVVKGNMETNGNINMLGNTLTLYSNINSFANIVTTGDLSCNLLTSYYGVNSTGLGLPLMVSNANLSGLTSNQTILTYTVPNTFTNAEFLITGNVDMTAYTSGTMSLDISWTKPSGGTQSGGITGIVPGFSSSTGLISSVRQLCIFPFNIRAKGNTNITLSTNGLTTGTYDASVKIYLVSTT